MKVTKKTQKNPNCFGGSLLKGNPRCARPLHTRQAMHLVLRSSKAKGRWALNHPGRRTHVQNIIKKQADNQGLKIYELAINGNHIHLLCQTESREAYRAFIRAITGLIVRIVLKKERGNRRSLDRRKTNRNKSTSNALKKKGSWFWDTRPFSRLVMGFGRAFHEARFYVIQNHLEAIGYLSYRPRHQRVPRLSDPFHPLRI